MKMAAESVRTRRFRVFAPGAPRARPRKTSVPARVHLLFTHKFNGSLLAECPDQFGFTARAECRLGGCFFREVLLRAEDFRPKAA